MNLLGIDIGGTKTAVCVGRADGTILSSQRMPTQPGEGPAAWRQRLGVLVRGVTQEAGVTLSAIASVGMACPGPMSVARGMMLAPPNMRGWVDVPVKAWVEEDFGRPVLINNDANACALAEWRYGGCAGVDNLLYLTMSTGMGGGIVAGGRLVQGANDMGGEVGHFVLDIHGPSCPCGQRGCFEMYCGGMNVANRLRTRILNEGIATVILDEAGGDPVRIDFHCFMDAVRKRDAFALEALDEYLERLAQGVGILLMTLNPSAIVMGTIAIHHGEIILPELRRRLAGYAWPQTRECVIMPSKLEARIGELSALAVAAGP